MKNSKRVISLLIMTATVMSTIPAFAADFTDYNGDINTAIAYKSKTGFIDGDIENKGSGTYYYNGSSYKAKDDDLDQGDSPIVYGDKYLEFSSDTYLDMSSGAVKTDSIREDNLDDAETNLRKAIKEDNDGRYANTAEDTNTVLTEIKSNKFKDTWYEGDVTADSISGTDNGSSSTFKVYTDVDGKYIDADYEVGKIIAYTTTGASVSIKNTKDDDNGIRAAIKDSTVIGSDDTYIYRKAYLTYTTTNGTIDITNQMVFSTSKIALKDTSGVALTRIPVIQKISKAVNSSDEEGAKLPSTVETYVVSDEDCKTIDTTGSFSISDGNIVVYKTVASDTITAKTLTPTNKNGFYCFSVEDADLSIGTSSEFYTDTDVDGNLWVISKGKVYEYDNKNDFDSKYKTDGSINKISVYDKNNIVAWSSNSDVYALLGGASSSASTDTSNTDIATDTTETTDTSTTTTDATNTTVSPSAVVKLSWEKDKEGKWIATNAKSVGWVLDNATWYFIDSQKKMQTGWLMDKGSWYFLNEDGSMKTGWLSNSNNDWYLLSSSGSMVTGWVESNGTWYYIYSNGAMAKNTMINGYKVGPNGAWIK